MDSSGAGQGTDEIRREIAELQARVGRLEAQYAAADPQALAAPARPAAAAASPGSPTPPLSFVPPDRPSLESRIGSQLFNRVGIVAVLVGVAWFLKYAVDRSWLGASARVIIGLVAGLALIAWSERFRRSDYPVFSFSLKAVGTGILYLALWAAYSLFHLVPYPVAFLGMVLVTVGNAWMCWRQSSEVLAAFAAIGGFLTPALLAQPQSSVLVLDSYLVLLNAALFFLMAARRWPSLLPVAFAGTSSYLVGLALHAASLGDQRGAALLLATVSFAAFSLAPVLVAGMASAATSNLEPAARIAAAMALVNTAVGGFAVWRLLPPGSFPAHWVPIGVAAWYALLLAATRLRPVSRQALVPVHAALVIAWTALGLWSALTGGGIIAGWALEAAVLLLLTLRPRPAPSDRILGSALPAAILLLLSAALLVWDSFAGALGPADRVILNERFALYLMVIAVAVAAVRLAALQHGARQQATVAPGTLAGWTRMGAGSAVLAVVLLLTAGVFEIHTYWNGNGAQAEQFSDSTWATLLGVALLGLGFRLRWAFLRWQALGLLTLAIAKVFLVDTRSLSQGFRILSFLGLGVLLLCVSFTYQRDLLNLRGKEHGG